MGSTPNDDATPDQKDAWVNPDPLWPIPEWSGYVGITPDFTRQLIKQGRLTSVRIGGKVLLRKSTADSLIAMATRPATKPLAVCRFHLAD
jgi:excisionase family DNA binding protein